MSLRNFAIAVSAFACATLFSLGWSEQGGVSLSVGQADARVYVSRYAARTPYVNLPGLSWYAVRAYYADGPWQGVGYSYTGWADYAGRNGIACVPGSIVKGGDGIMYVCQ